ncbi:hypothetical protein [Nonomuraea guangzhouensis]|uniref:WXG100 family type VII secretion target n=1 Tax=Nonomuraea guangzhouensis TaxID=1291555 RepID=A0ABW4G2I9_9ACTN|nr:hypothetical protein [Nonomuraea guangzhouensis]
MREGLRIERGPVEAGLARWDAMAADLDGAVRDAVARIERLHVAAPWGGDSAGREFQRAYMEDDGPDLVLSWARSMVGEIVDTGTAVRQSVDGSVEAEAASFSRRRA